MGSGWVRGREKSEFRRTFDSVCILLANSLGNTIGIQHLNDLCGSLSTLFITRMVTWNPQGVTGSRNTKLRF